LSAIAGIGGGVVMVPFLYLVYRHTPATPSAQTVVAHATSLGVAFVTSTAGTWRYARSGAVAWRMAATYAIPGIFSAFITARLLTRAGQTLWIRAAFGLFLLVCAADMARRTRALHPPPGEHPPHSPLWLGLTGIAGGAASSLLGIGGGLIAVPVLLYVGRLPVESVAPTALAGVCLTTLAGGVGYLTAGPGPAVSGWMAGFIDFRMMGPLTLGAICTVPLGVKLNRASSPPTLYWIFALLFATIGVSLIRGWLVGH
jgi:uncharacterized protein